MGKNPTDRGKKGTKESVLVDADGGPLGAVIAAANVNDHLLLRETIEAIVVERPEPTPEEPQHLCLDADYDNTRSREVAAAEQYTPHIVPAAKEKRSKTRGRGHKPRRWVVERTLAWLSKCRAILVRYDKNLRFARIRGRSWESASDLLVQISGQVPEVEKSLLHLRQR